MEVNDYLDIMAVWYRDVLLFKATNDVNHLVLRRRFRRCARRREEAAMRESRVFWRPWKRPKTV